MRRCLRKKDFIIIYIIANKLKGLESVRLSGLFCGAGAEAEAEVRAMLKLTEYFL